MKYTTALPKLIHLEFMKSRHKPSFMLIAAMILINYFYLFHGIADDGQQWLNIFYGIPLINSIFLSLYMAILASQAVDIENKGAMWNLLPTLESRTSIYLAKNLYGLIHLTLFCVLQMGMVALLGKILHFPGALPFYAFGMTLLAEIVSGTILFQVQCLISLLFPSQFAALSIGFGGTLTGLFLAYLSTKTWTPWSVLLSLGSVGMNYQEASASMTLYWSHPSTWQIMIALFYLLSTFLIGLYLFTASEQDKVWGSTSLPRTSRSLHSIYPEELIKLKHNPVWIPFFLIPLISAIIGTLNFTQNQGLLHFTWGDLWTQQSLFLGFFFLAPLIGVLCSLLWRMEHQGSNWNLIMTVTSPLKLVKDKWLTATLLSAFCIIWVAAIYLISGKILGIPGSVPAQYWSRLLGMLVCITAIAALQSMLSLIFHSFALPVALSFAGSLSGLALVIKGAYYLTPYSLLIYGMGSTSITGNLNLPIFLASCSLWICGSLALGIFFLKKTDVRTHI